VADRVVQGQSAEPLLSQMAGGGASSSVQHDKTKGGGGAKGGKGAKPGGGDKSKEFQAAEAFVDKGVYGPHAYKPPTGFGGFDTWYWPFKAPTATTTSICRSRSASSTRSASRAARRSAPMPIARTPPT